jgi:uncharacterized membrane protein
MALSTIFISGLLYGFSDFIMRGLNSLSPKSATEAMQNINVTVYKSLFMFLFILLTIGSLVVAIWSVLMNDWQDSVAVLSGSILYFFGMFLLTGRGNVPLNESLRKTKTSSSSSDAQAVWLNYYKKWTRLNTLRCVFGVLAGICWLMASYAI